MPAPIYVANASYLTRAAAEKLLHSRSSIYRYIKEKKLPATPQKARNPSGYVWVIQATDLNKFAKGHCQAWNDKIRCRLKAKTLKQAIEAKVTPAKKTKKTKKGKKGKK